MLLTPLAGARGGIHMISLTLPKRLYFLHLHGNALEGLFVNSQIGFKLGQSYIVVFKSSANSAANLKMYEENCKHQLKKYLRVVLDNQYLG